MPNNNGGLLRDLATEYYVIRFGNYYTGVDGIRGRIAELATINEDGSYTYEDGYVLGSIDTTNVFILSDKYISKLVNFAVYDPQLESKENFWNIPSPRDPLDLDYIIDHTFDGKIKNPNINVYFALDPNWNSDDSDSSSPRVQIAHGQSDITRHESYFKEEMSPNYNFQDVPNEIIELMKLLRVLKPEDISFNLVDNNGALGIFTDDSRDPKSLIAIANQYEYNEKAGESIKSYHYTLDDVNKNELLNYSKAVVSNAWESLEGVSYFILSSEAMKYLDGKATVLGGQK